MTEDKISANDVAAYILSITGEITSMKLEKLLYYSQAWSLVWDDEPLFDEPIEAWINGPVIPAIYKQHRGLYNVNAWPSGNPCNLNYTQRETVDAVLDHYGDKSSQWLSDLTHQEMPWIEARKGLPANDRGDSIISLASMAEYYSSLLYDEE